MTQFWREGFMRTSVNGNTHWVEGHWVDRDDWDRYSSSVSQSSYYIERLRELRAGRSATSCFVNPNADCPVCGQPVFFYQNQHGSRVYFDELGPPWPKHPCTDHAEFSRSSNSSDAAQVFPNVRQPSQLLLIDSWQSHAGIDAPHSFRTKYGTSQWSAWRLVGHFRASKTNLLILESVDAIQKRRKYFSIKRLPKSLTDLSVIFVYRGWLTYFDHETMNPVEIEVQKIASASGFIDQLIKKE